MSDADDDLDEGVPDDDGDDGAPRKKRNLRRLIIFITAPLALVILLVAGAIFMGIGPFGSAEEQPAAEAPVEGAPAEGEAAAAAPANVGFYELPQMLVNLNTDTGTSTFLRMTVALELSSDTPEARARLDAMLPRVIDNFQVYMRELRLADLNGSAGMFRLKQELLSRINRAVAPVQVSDVLFSELLVQ